MLATVHRPLEVYPSEGHAAGIELLFVLGDLLVDDDVRYLQAAAHSVGLVLLTLGPSPTEENIVGRRSVAKEKLVGQ